MKRMLAMLLCLAMVLSMAPVSALATEVDEPAVVQTQPQEVPTEAAEEPAEVEEETTEAAEETIPEETVPEETVPVETVPEETVPAETVPAEAEALKAVDAAKRAALKAAGKAPLYRHKLFEKTVKSTKTVRKAVSNADGTVTFKDEDITVTDTVRQWKKIDLNEGASNELVQDEYEAWFTTFEELKILVDSGSEYLDVYYEGEEPLVIAETIELPESMWLYAEAVVIPQTVTLSVGEHMWARTLTVEGNLVTQQNASLSAGNLTVSGNFYNAGYCCVENALTITGHLRNAGDMDLMEKPDAASLANLENTGSGTVDFTLLCENLDDFLAAVQAAKELPESWGCFVELAMTEDITLTQSLTIPDNANVYIYSSEYDEDDGGYTFTVAEGCTLELNTYLDMGVNMLVKGSLVNNTGLNVVSGLEFAQSGAYSGAGVINIYCGEEEIPDHLTGLDLNDFHIRRTLDGVELYHKDYVKVLAAPADLTWHLAYVWDEEAQKEVVGRRPGYMAWKGPAPTQGDYHICLYAIEEDEEEPGEYYDVLWYETTYCWNPNNLSEMPEWLTADLFLDTDMESGTYYFTVQNIPCDDEEYQHLFDESYISSEIIKSENFVYQRPTQKEPTPKNLQIKPVTWADGEESLVVYWDGSAERFQAEWFYSPEPVEDVLEEAEASSLTTGTTTPADQSAPISAWLLEECGEGYYYCRVQIVTNDIEKTVNSDWSEIAGPYYYYDAADSAYKGIAKALEQSPDAATLRQKLAELDKDRLTEGLQKDKEGKVRNVLEMAEEMAGGPVQVKLSSGFSAFGAGEVSVLGANLNMPASAEDDIALVIGAPAKTHTLTGELNSPYAVQFSMKLENVTQQTVPVVVTLPLPAQMKAAEAIVLHHTADGDEVLTPIASTETTITVVVSDFSDFTITADTFTQDEFVAAYRAAQENGEYGYILNKPLTLTRDLTLDVGETEYFSFEIGPGGALVIPKGITLTMDGVYTSIFSGGSMTINGTFTALNYAGLEAVSGKITVASDAVVNVDSIGLYLNYGGELNGWPTKKTSIYASPSTEAQIHDFLAMTDQYYTVSLQLADNAQITLTKDLKLPGNGYLWYYSGSIIVPSGLTLTVNSTLGVGEMAVLQIEQGAKLINNTFMYVDGILNLNGTYDGLGEFDIYGEVNGKLIHMTIDDNDWETLTLFAHLHPEDPNAQFVWEILSGSEYAKLDVSGNKAVASDKIEVTESHEIIVKVSTKDGSVSNTFSFWIVPDDYGSEHTHDYKEKEVVAPTYTKPGYTIYECECGETITGDEVAALGLPKPTVTVSNNSVTGAPVLTWTHDGEADQYDVYRATSKTGKYTKVGSADNTATYTDSAAAGKTWYYKVKAICNEDSKLSSGYSAIVSAASKCAQPAVTVEVNTVSGKPVLKWAKVTGAAKYTVYRATVEDGEYTAVKTVTTTSYTDTTAQIGHYYYKVKAVASKSAYSGEQSAMVSCLAICGQPAVTISVSSSTGKPTLSWKQITGAVEYDIYRADSRDGEFTKLATQTELTFTDTTTAPGKEYWYKVNAIALVGLANSVDGTPKSVTTVLATPSVVFAVNEITGKPVLVWNAVEGAVEYTVYRSASATKSYKPVATVTETSYTDTTVSVGKGYYYKVVAVGESGSSAYSAYKKLTAKCAQPVITVEANASSGKPVVKWEKITGAKKYTVYRATSEAGKYTTLKTVTTTSYTDTSAKVGTTYYYKVKAVASSASYSSVDSEIFSCLTVCARPAVTVKADGATGKPVLSWKAVSGAVEYRVYGHMENGEAYLLSAQTGCAYSHTEAPVDTICTYEVEAIGVEPALNSASGNVVSVLSTLAKPAVTFTVDAVTGKPALIWNAVEGAVEYTVYRSTSATKSYKPVATVTETGYTDTTASVGKGYYYKVVAVGENSSSAYSAYKKLTAKCAQPVITVEAGSTGKPVVKWAKITGAKKYEVYRATSETGKYTKVTTATSAVYTDSKATVGTTYFYKVKAVAAKTTYNSVYSEVQSCLTICGQPALTVTVSSATGKPSLSWKKITGAVSYDIYRAEAENGEFTKLANQTALTYADTTAQPDTDYWYKVNAIGASEALNSADGTAKKVHTTLAKPAVTFTVDAVTGKPTLTWTAVEGAVEYKVYRSASATKSYTVAATVTDTTYTDTSVSVGKGYYYKVIAVGENSSSAYSAYKKLTAKCAQPIIAVELNSSGKPVLKWEKVTGAKKYTVYRASSEDGKYTSLKTTTSTSYTDASAKTDTIYYYKVKALGSKTAYNSVDSAVVSSQTETDSGTITRPSYFPAVVELQNTTVLKGKKLGISVIYTGDQWCADTADALEAIAACYGAEVICQDAQLSAERQYVQIENMLQNGCDYLMVSPVDPDAVNGVLDQAYNSGVPITIFDGTWESGEEKAQTTVTFSQKELGTKMGDYFVNYVKQNMDGEATVAVLANTVSTHCQQRYDGFMEVVDQANADGCQITVVGRFDAQGNREVALSTTKTAVAEFDPDFFLGETDNMAMGAVDYLRTINDTTTKVLSLNAYGDEPFDLLQDNDPNYMACVNVNAWILAQKIIDSAIAYYEGIDNPVETYMPLYVTDHSNIKDFMPK